MKTTTERREHIETLINRAEEEVQRNPKVYSLKVGTMALLGYLVIFGMLFTLIAIVVGIGWAAFMSSALLLLLIKKKLIIVVLLMVYVMVRALWVKFETPTGYLLKRKQFPELFAELDGLSKQLKSPRVHQVILTSEYNAGILQTPRLGVFGWYKNTLFLGLELLMSMTSAQARSVIAHELGHLSGEHSRFSGWIYRVRMTWQRIMDAFEHQDNVGARIMRSFFRWYAPAFAAYSFALARANEYQADAVAAELTSLEDVAHALVNSHVMHDLIHEHYWQPFLAKASDSPAPEESPYRAMAHFLANNTFEQDMVSNRIEQAMATETSHYDTHPSLNDRLSALNAPSVVPALVEQSAARAWLAGNLDQVINDFDADWLSRNEQAWNERYQYVQEGRQKLQELAQKNVDELDAEQTWQFAVLTEEFHQDVDPLPLYQRYHQLCPDDLDVHYVMGRILLSRQDEAGVALMEQAMAQPQLILDACQWLYQYCLDKDDKTGADHWREKAEQQMDINNAAEAERATVQQSDELYSPELSQELRQWFLEQISTVSNVKHIWIAEKRMEHYPESRTFVVAFQKKGFGSKEEQITEQLLEVLAMSHTLFVVMKGGEHKGMAKVTIKKGVKLV